MIYIGSDHGGFDLKNILVDYIKNELKLEIEDIGTHSKDSVDYPDFAKAVCDKVLKNNGIGILICSTGIGISISANKINGIRCALCSDDYSAKMSRKHNYANVLALGGLVIGPWLAKSIVETFITTTNDINDRHKRRVDKISKLESC